MPSLKDSCYFRKKNTKARIKIIVAKTKIGTRGVLARYKCWRCNKTETSKRCAIFVVYIADLEILFVDIFVDNCEVS